MLGRCLLFSMEFYIMAFAGPIFKNIGQNIRMYINEVHACVEAYNWFCDFSSSLVVT
jgi:hypothetical protein